ncbi:uncharacterized protein PgNI_00607, partial [Pyricularia grisea]|uniref:Uncharacterized protein n=1 Tax=Pyricularia grisea TaxID=148305 RepID=A0A6P8BI54_PYRGI
SQFSGSAHHRAGFFLCLWPERTLSGFTKFGKSDPSTVECGRKPQNFEFTPPNGFLDGLNSIEGFRPVANAPLQHSRALDAAACADR